MSNQVAPIPESYLPLHALEFQLLLTLNQGVAHAYRMVGDIEARQPEWGRILPTNLYRRIWRLAADGLIEEVEQDEAPTTRSRKYFKLTALGRQVAVAEAGRLQALLLEAQQMGVHLGGIAGGEL